MTLVMCCLSVSLTGCSVVVKTVSRCRLMVVQWMSGPSAGVVLWWFSERQNRLRNCCARVQFLFKLSYVLSNVFSMCWLFNRYRRQQDNGWVFANIYPATICQLIWSFKLKTFKLNLRILNQPGMIKLICNISKKVLLLHYHSTGRVILPILSKVTCVHSTGRVIPPILSKVTMYTVLVVLSLPYWIRRPVYTVLVVLFLPYWVMWTVYKVLVVFFLPYWVRWPVYTLLIVLSLP